MKYRLGLYKGPQLIKTFSYLPRFSDYELNASKLEDIVTFTHSFPNEDELIWWLLEEDLITSKEATGEPAIVSFRQPEGIRLPYGLSYSGDKKYYDIDFLPLYYVDQIQDQNFMERFLDIYYPKYRNIPYLKSINGVYNGYNYTLHNEDESNVQEIYEDLFTALKAFVFKYITRENKKGEIEPNFSRLRELAMFAIHNERAKKYSHRIETIESIRIELEHYRNLLQEALTDEEKVAYRNAIVKLERKLAKKGGN